MKTKTQTQEKTPQNSEQTAPAETSQHDETLQAAGRRIFERFPDQPEVHMTSNGFGFFRMSDAHNHAETLKDHRIVTVTRK